MTRRLYVARIIEALQTPVYVLDADSLERLNPIKAKLKHV